MLIHFKTKAKLSKNVRVEKVFKIRFIYIIISPTNNQNNTNLKKKNK